MRSFFARRFLRAFSKRYSYDVSYLEHMLKAAPAAFFKFARVGRASGHREVVPVEASFAAKSLARWRRIAGPARSSSSTWPSKPAWRGPR